MRSLQKIFFILIALSAGTKFASAQPRAATPSNVPEVEWYPPEIEKGSQPDRSKVIITGRTQPGSLVQIDAESVSLLKGGAAQSQESERQLRVACKAYQSPNIQSKVVESLQRGEILKVAEYSTGWLKVFLPNGVAYVSLPCFVSAKAQGNIEARANNEGFFELSLELPQGLTQMPITVIAPKKNPKTFLISVDVNIVKDDIKIDTKVSKNKPPAAAKKIRLWAGAGFTYQTYAQSTSGMQSLSFQTVQAPGLVFRGGYWGDQFGVDFYFRDAPGEIAAEAPLQVENNSYHWRTMEAKGLYQIPRDARSRMLGLPSQWQVRFGVQTHQIPFFNISNTNVVSVEDVNLMMGTLGVGLLLGQERAWSYEFALGLQTPLSAKGPGSSFGISSPFGYEAQLGAAYKFAPNWRLGLFSYTQSVSYTYKYTDQTALEKSGKQDLFYTTLDLRLGYEF